MKQWIMEMKYLKENGLENEVDDRTWFGDFISSTWDQKFVEPITLEKPQAMKNEMQVSDFMWKNNI